MATDQTSRISARRSHARLASSNARMADVSLIPGTATKKMTAVMEVMSLMEVVCHLTAPVYQVISSVTMVSCSIFFSVVTTLVNVCAEMYFFIS